MRDIIIYKTEKEEMRLEHLYTVEEHASYYLEVKSNGFFGGYLFCIPIDYVKKLVIEINKILDELRGNICLLDYDSDAYVKLGYEDSKLFQVKGQIGGSHQSHMLTFEFEADQTILIGLKRNLLEY
ncbi:MAG: hypothetical protein RSG52_10200 [Terrisporobacter sp.]|uniref:hypothetical protein n=1 Tax=Clostridia TaxID=186801 RepID=UPI002FC61092